MVEPAARVEPETRYWDSAFGVMVCEPIVRATGSVPAAEGTREVLGPNTTAVEPLDVWSARTVVEVPEPRVMLEPGARVWPDTMYWDCAFGVMVSLLMMIGAGALAGGMKALSADVVRTLEPAALVVVRIMAGRLAVEERTVPWALVEVTIVGIDTEMGAVERLVEVTMLP